MYWLTMENKTRKNIRKTSCRIRHPSLESQQVAMLSTKYIIAFSDYGLENTVGII
jgi:hypothetical protein